MITKVLIMTLSFFIMVINLSYIIIYINLLTFGYTIKEYMIFILQRYEFYLFIIGFVTELLCIYCWKENKK